jgi:hypothetical protein
MLSVQIYPHAQQQARSRLIQLLPVLTALLISVSRIAVSPKNEGNKRYINMDSNNKVKLSISMSRSKGLLSPAFIYCALLAVQTGNIFAFHRSPKFVLIEVVVVVFMHRAATSADQIVSIV